MSAKVRRTHSPEFKAKVALAALANEDKLVNLAEEFAVHRTLINEWRRQLVERAPSVFEMPAKTPDSFTVIETKLEQLQQQIGRMQDKINVA